MARSDTSMAVSVSVALLLPGVGSVVPAGAVTVAVLTRLAVAEDCAVPVTVKTTELAPPAGMLTVADRLVPVSVALLLAVLGSVVPAGALTVAVLLRKPLAEGSTVPLTVKTTELPAPAGMLTVAARLLPEPLAPEVTEAVPVTLEAQ